MTCNVFGGTLNLALSMYAVQLFLSYPLSCCCSHLADCFEIYSMKWVSRADYISVQIYNCSCRTELR